MKKVPRLNPRSARPSIPDVPTLSKRLSRNAHELPFVVALVLALLLVLVPSADARDIHVDPHTGDDASASGPFKSIPRAIKFAQPGDTIHLKPIVYRDYAGFYGKRGEPGKPIILDGHGATLEGSDPLDPDQWRETEPGLFHCDELLPRLDDAIIGRWFFLWNGEMKHMGRASKGASAKLKAPKELQHGEWTFVKDPERSPTKPGQIFGAFHLKLPPGQSLADANIFVPTRSAGVQFSGSRPNHNAHLVIRNLTATHPYNDGFNIHGHCEDVVFENIRAIECGDDGISAHETAQYRVDGFVSIGNSTGICDTGESQTSYNNVFIRDCLAFDLYFLDKGRYSVSNAVILSSSRRALHLTGRDFVDRPCSLRLDNVYIRRITDANEVRISKNSTLDARRVTLLGLNFQATGGDVRLHDSIIAGVPAADDFRPTYEYIAARAKSRGPLSPEILLWKDAEWTADNNRYDPRSLRVDKTFYTEKTFAEFQKRTGQDARSRWAAPDAESKIRGAVLKDLLQKVVPAAEHHRFESF